MIKTPWENKPESTIGLAGFIYRIVNKMDGREYIGKKFFWSHRTKAVRGKKRKKRVKVESDWEYYISSSKLVKQDIKTLGYDNFQFTIIECFKTRAEVNYAEVRLQVLEDVLNSKMENGSWKYYNQNILRKFWKKRA